MGLQDAIYDAVHGYLDDGNYDSDDLYHAISDCFSNSLVYSWSLYDIEQFIMRANGTDSKPTYDSKRFVLRQITGRYPSRKYPVTEDEIREIVSNLLADGEINFVNENKIKLVGRKIKTKIFIPEIINVVEMQGDLYDLCEKFGLKLKINKDCKPGRIIFDLELEGETMGLMKVKDLLQRQLKLGAKILPKEKDESKKQEATE